jgi:phosphatidate phosphatase APP1
LRQEEQVIFFPSLAYPVDKGTWEIQIHGCVFEPEKRPIGLFLLRLLLGLDHIHVSKAENALFLERARLFMVDHEGGTKIVVRIGDQTFKVGKSTSNGHFVKTFRFSDAEIQKLRSAETGIRLVLPARDKRLFSADIHFMDDAGTMVISDIDDTIKITGVTDSNSLLRNTLLKTFQPVPGMAELYHNWAQSGQVEFCYVSASPWQLFSPLADFIRSNSFPTGPFYLKTFRLKDQSGLSLFESPEKYKPGVIEPILKQFPHRKFVLVGDSGEKDPEIYAALAKKFPDQVTRIFIRDLQDGTNHFGRFNTAFEGLPAERWKIFHDPSEISNLAP